MPEIELSAEVVEYEDTSGDGPAVLLHGVLMNATGWRKVVPGLRRDYRCARPTLPLGSHRQAPQEPQHPRSSKGRENVSAAK